MVNAHGFGDFFDCVDPASTRVGWSSQKDAPLYSGKSTTTYCGNAGPNSVHRCSNVLASGAEISVQMVVWPPRRCCKIASRTSASRASLAPLRLPACAF